MNLNLIIKNNYHEKKINPIIFIKIIIKNKHIYFPHQPSKNYHSSAYILPTVHVEWMLLVTYLPHRSSYSIFFSNQLHCFHPIRHLDLWGLESGQPISLQKVSPFIISCNILDFNKFRGNYTLSIYESSLIWFIYS